MTNIAFASSGGFPASCRLGQPVKADRPDRLRRRTAPIFALERPCYRRRGRLLPHRLPSNAGEFATQDKSVVRTDREVLRCPADKALNVVEHRFGETTAIWTETGSRI